MKKFAHLLLALSLIFSSSGFVSSNYGFLVDKHPAWCTGADGALSLNGTDVHIPAGSKKDYSSITMINSAHLIIDAGSGWTQICVSGNAAINTGAAIVADNSETVYGDTLYKTAEDGRALSNTYSAIYGGSGGLDGAGTPGGAGPGFAGGGGGAGGGMGSDATLLNGGNGAGGAELCSAGIGGIGPSGAGSDASGSCVDTGGSTFGAGGGGGARGYHGGSVYFKVAGTLTVTGVVFSSNGADGGSGGGAVGGQDDSGGCGWGAGGGGGGSGGSGGKWVIRYHLGLASGANVSVAAGNGAGGGSGAAGIAGAHGGADCGDGTFGDDGQSGDAGSSDIASF